MKENNVDDDDVITAVISLFICLLFVQGYGSYFTHSAFGKFCWSDLEPRLKVKVLLDKIPCPDHIFFIWHFLGKNLIHRVPFGKWCAIILSKMSRFKTLVKNPCWNLIFLALSGSYLCLLVKDVQWAMTCNRFKFLSQKQRSKQIFFLSPLYYFGQTLPKDCI